MLTINTTLTHISRYTLGVCPLTLPARAKDPCTLPPNMRISTSTVDMSATELTNTDSSANGCPALYRARSSIVAPDRLDTSA